MSEFTQKENPLQRIDQHAGAENQLTRLQKVAGVSTVEKLKSGFEQLPDEGILYCVDFGIADVTSTDFLSEPDRFPNMWGEDGYRGYFPSSGALTKAKLIEYFSNIDSLPTMVKQALQHGVPFGVRIRVWQENEGADPNLIENKKPDSVVEIANTTIARNL